ncbi:hypothetical protein HRbin29_00090 [bacterium HR29]|jgi:hypothetical protein|nr:hypothetical protein HRbin29_00090 [bacterium HR29]
MAQAPSLTYPVSLEVAPPESQNRLSILFRLLLVIPHAIVLYFLQLAVQFVVFLAWFIILFAGRFPTGLWRFVCGSLRWATRVNAYTLLLTGRYPPFALEDDLDYPVRLLAEERTDNRNRLTVFFRIILVIPHVLVLYFLALAQSVALVIAWFAALLTGRVPGGLHDFIAGVLRWNTRVNAYVLLLVDEYPPFSLS